MNPAELASAAVNSQTSSAASQPVARLYGEPMLEYPKDLYIPPDALEVFLERFEGPLDLLLWLIRSQKFDVMDIPMALLTEQYMAYVELIRRSNLELASAYLVMSATLMSIKSRMLLPKRQDAETGEEPEDPRAELMRRLLNMSVCVLRLRSSMSFRAWDEISWLLRADSSSYRKRSFLL